MTEDEQRNLSLAEAATRFLASLPAHLKQEGQQEINKFVRWYGGERNTSDLTIHEVANYAEAIGTSAVNPMKRLEPVKAFLSYAKKQRLVTTKLAIHLRVRKGTSKRRTLANKRYTSTISLTAQGYAELKSELDALKNQRPRVADELRRAAADKDFRENAPLDAAREYQGQLEARIRELEATLKAATIASEKKIDTQKASLGSTIRLRDLTFAEELRYTLVNPREANPAKGKLSIASPTGKALLDRGEGEVVEVAAPMGILRYQIEQIEH